MTYRKYGLGLLVVAIGMMAFAASAQAVTSEFLINKKVVGALKANVTATQVGTSALLVKALNLKLECKKFTIQAGIINTGKDADGKLLYEECVPLTLAGGAFPKCEVVVSAVDKKHHVTATALILPAEFLTTFKLLPAILAEKINAKILIHSTDPAKPECVLPETTNVKGELCLEVHNNDSVTPEILASEAIQEKCKPRLTLEGTEMNIGTKFKDQLLFGAQVSVVDGAAKLSLTGAHAGLTLGVSLVP